MRLFTTLLASLGLLAASIGLANAQVSCTRYGNTTYCSGSSGNTSCTTYGNTTYCN